MNLFIIFKDLIVGSTKKIDISTKAQLLDKED